MQSTSRILELATTWCYRPLVAAPSTVDTIGHAVVFRSPRPETLSVEPEAVIIICLGHGQDPSRAVCWFCRKFIELPLPVCVQWNFNWLRSSTAAQDCNGAVVSSILAHKGLRPNQPPSVVQ